MLSVIKRNGEKVKYDGDKITVAIGKAMVDAKFLDIELSKKIEEEIFQSLTDNGIEEVEIETIQDMVEDALIEHSAIKAAKAYIKYRAEQTRARRHEKDDESYGILSKEFLSKYKHAEPPMTDLGASVYFRTYSRYLPDKQRREYWWETVRRAVEYNVSLIPTSRKEAEDLFDNIFNLRQFLSGRTLFTGGTEVSKKYPMSNYNCSFQIVDELESFRDIFYLLMIGSGAGLRIKKSDVEKLPKFRSDVDIIPMVYQPKDKKDRLESTELRFKTKNIAEVVVGDSKEGWVQSLDFVLKLLTASEYKHIHTILMDFNSVRPKGERLKTFGGTASGSEALINIFVKLEKILMKHREEKTYKLKTIDALDIANIIGEGVVVGGGL
jgi:ribonucleoside-diphosphate reductase alpha chain/ribonucleoside-triphosphate reductase